MDIPLVLLIVISILVYCIVFITHSMRMKYSLAPFYGLLGVCTTMMIWTTDLGIKVEFRGMTFLAGSTVFYMSVLLSVFIIYVFDGSGCARAAIFVVLGITFIVPFLIKSVNYVHLLNPSVGSTEIRVSTVKLYVFSSLALLADFIYIAVFWQLLSNRFRQIPFIFRVFITLYLSLCIDAIIFVGGAFYGTGFLLPILEADILSRLILSVCITPILSVYMKWQTVKYGDSLANRPILSILYDSTQAEQKLSSALTEIESQKIIEESLRESEERYRLVFSHSPLGILHFNEEGVVVDVNNRLCDIFGTSRERLLGLNMLRSLKNDNMVSAIRDALDGKPGEFGGEYTSILSGKKVFLRGYFKRINNDDGKLLGAVALFEDITESVESSEKIRFSEQRFKDIAFSAGEYIWEVNAFAQYTYLSHRVENILGYPRNKILGQTPFDFMPEDDADRARNKFKEILKAKESFRSIEHRSITGDGKIIWQNVSGAPIFDKNDGLIGYRGVGQDITRRKTAEESLKRREEILEAISFAAASFLKQESWKENLKEVLRHLGIATDVTRVYVYQNHEVYEGVYMISFVEEWTSSEYDKSARNLYFKSFAYKESGFERWEECLRNREIIFGHVHEFPENEQQLLKASDIKSIAIVPIFSGEKWWGFIGFDDCLTEKDWTQIEIDALRTAAETFGAAIQKQTADEALEKARIRELEVQSNIEETLLRGKVPAGLKNIDIAASSIPSQYMDGDFYDFMLHHKKYIDVIIGDVMGKGIQAALVGVAMKNTFIKEFLSLETDAAENHIPTVEKIVHQVHASVTERLMSLERFVTINYIRINLDDKKMMFVDCGHPPIIHYSAEKKECSFLKGDNMPIGFVPQETHQAFNVELKTGDKIILYSDGITEAKNPRGDMFGKEGIAEFALNNSNLDSPAFIDKLKINIREYTQGEKFSDDFTCIVISVL